MSELLLTIELGSGAADATPGATVNYTCIELLFFTGAVLMVEI
jgi:hypothetical protein